MITIEMLKDVPIFRELADYELANIAKTAHEEIYESDQRIFAEGALAHKMYILLDGQVDIRIRPNRESDELTVDTIMKGEIFGWSALTEPHSLTAAAWTTKRSRVIVLNGASLLDLFEKNNHIGYLVIKGIASVISLRLRHIRAKMLELLHPSEKAKKGKSITELAKE